MPKKDENKANNIIEFPKQPSSAGVSQTAAEQRAVPRRRKIIMGGSIAAVFALAVLVNGVLLTESPTASGSSRSLASVSASSQRSERQRQWEQQLAEKLSQKGTRNMASLGGGPSPEEKFRFETLEGKYAVRFSQGKVREVNFPQRQVATGQPKFVNDRAQFLKQNQELLPVDFHSAETKDKEIKKDRVFETYSLYNKNDVEIARVSFELNIHGQLLSMEVNESTSASQ